MKTKQLAEYLRVHASAVRAAGYLATSGVLEMAASRLEDQRARNKTQRDNMRQVIANFKTAQEDAINYREAMMGWKRIAERRAIDLAANGIQPDGGSQVPAEPYPRP